MNKNYFFNVKKIFVEEEKNSNKDSNDKNIQINSQSAKNIYSKRQKTILYEEKNNIIDKYYFYNKKYYNTSIGFIDDANIFRNTFLNKDELKFKKNFTLLSNKNSSLYNNHIFNKIFYNNKNIKKNNKKNNKKDNKIKAVKIIKCEKLNICHNENNENKSKYHTNIQLKKIIPFLNLIQIKK